MSVELYGWVEIRDAELDERDGEIDWYAVVNIRNLVDEYSSSLLGSFFGIRNNTYFEPIVSAQGLPPNASFVVEDELASWDGYSVPVWISWEELLKVD